jgi:glutamate/tyrosine decarboxylase-like PLP-dependent enzyme
VIAPSVISADSPRFLGFISAAPTKAGLLFDMLVSCASIQGVSWLEASGAIAAENTVLRLIADEAGLPPGAGGCFVSGGPPATFRRWQPPGRRPNDGWARPRPGVACGSWSGPRRTLRS